MQWQWCSTAVGELRTLKRRYGFWLTLEHPLQDFRIHFSIRKKKIVPRNFWERLILIPTAFGGQEVLTC